MSKTPTPLSSTLSWVVVDFSPAVSRRYIGSPSIAVLPGGAYVASHDLFGPGTSEFEEGVTVVFRSEDRGLTWRQTARLAPAFWSGLFVHEGLLYLMGTTHHHGDIVVRRSSDGGHAWTVPQGPDSGAITQAGQFHTAPVPVVAHGGRLWRAVESADHATTWPSRYSPRMLSIPVGADLLRRADWEWSESAPHDLHWLEDTFKGWLEGNAVATPKGGMANLLRVDSMQGEAAALIEVSGDGKTLSFDPARDFVKMPGGATKFTIRQDPVDRTYWALVNNVTTFDPEVPAASERNTLSLAHSDNLRDWELRGTLLHHPDRLTHAFQYTDWMFDGGDIIAAIRTAFTVDGESAHSPHDANFLTFHRFENFRVSHP